MTHDDRRVAAARGMLLPMLALLLLLLATPGFAGTPATLTVAAKPDGDTLVAKWPDVAGAEQKLTARFSAGTVSTAEALHFDEAALQALLGERLQAWATETRPGSIVTVKGTDVTLKTPLTTAGSADAENAAARDERARLYAALLVEQHLGLVGPGVLQYDHARIAAESAQALRPLVDALGGATKEPRGFATRALAFVQGIPTEELTRDTFAPPLAVLREQHGNCDEKATLYAALIRAAAPELPVAVLTMRAHALVGLGLPPLAGDRTVSVGGTAWVVADVAGPALYELGHLSARSDLVQLSVRVVP